MGGTRVGVLAEDATDCAALGVLIRRIARQSSDAPVGISFASAGSSCRSLGATGGGAVIRLCLSACPVVAMSLTLLTNVFDK
jgi:hypothetical protein